MQPRRRIWKLANAVILMTITALVLGSFVRVGINAHRRALFPDLVQGTAYKPFVYRALVPFMVRQVSAAVPESARIAIDRHLRDPVIRIPELRRVGLERVDWVEFLAAVLIWYLSVIGFAWAFKKLARSVYELDERFLDVLALGAVAGLPVFFKYHSYIYDLTHLFLFTACLIVLVRSSWAIYLPLFGLATFSKETSILLVAIFAVAYVRVLPRKSFALLISTQLLIFLAIRGLLSSYFAGNPGGTLTFHLLDHNLWLKPYTIAQFVGLAIIAMAIARDWASKPLFLRQCLLIIVPTLLFLTLFLGFLDEYRDYYEAYPVVLLLVAPAVAQLLGARPVRTSAPS